MAGAASTTLDATKGLLETLDSAQSSLNSFRYTKAIKSMAGLSVLSGGVGMVLTTMLMVCNDPV